MKRLSKMIAAVILSLSLLTSTSYAAPAWKLPSSGKILSEDAKQAYMANYMEKFFGGKINIKFAAPDKWTYEKFLINGVKVERLANPKQKKSSRVALQLHGGGYIGGLSDWYRDLAVKQAVLTEAREIFMVDYRLAPENVYPAALEDAAQVYKGLLRRGIDAKKYNCVRGFGGRKFGVGVVAVLEGKQFAATRNADFKFAVDNVRE